MDVVQNAAQLGRFDLASFLLACIGIILAIVTIIITIAGFIAYFKIKNHVKKTTEEYMESIRRSIESQICTLATSYLEEEIPAIVKERIDLMYTDMNTSEEIMENQEE